MRSSLRALYYFLCIYYTIKSSVFQYPRQKFLWIFWIKFPSLPRATMLNYIWNKLKDIDNTSNYRTALWHKSMKISIFFKQKNILSQWNLRSKNFSETTFAASPLSYRPSPCLSSNNRCNIPIIPLKPKPRSRAQSNFPQLCCRHAAKTENSEIEMGAQFASKHAHFDSKRYFLSCP